MLPALQPSRPKFPRTAQTPPLPFQQTRRTSSEAPGDSFTTTSTPNSAPTAHILQPSAVSREQSHPRSQIEAMPPTFAPPPPPAFTHPTGPILQPRLSNTPLSHHYDSSVRHPVFFSPVLRKPPFPLPNAGSGGVNPVAHGYVVEDGVNGGRGVRTKL